MSSIEWTNKLRTVQEGFEQRIAAMDEAYARRIAAMEGQVKTVVDEAKTNQTRLSKVIAHLSNLHGFTLD